MKGTAVGELRGRIVKGVGGFYYVNAGGTLYECKARGKFRVENMTPMVGDEVLFAPEEGKPKGYLSEILPRKNAMLRPPVSNVDQFVLVLSASVPRADFLLADKLLVQAEREKVLPLVCINKCDEADEELLGQIRNDYGSREMGFLMVSARTGEGLPQLKERLSGKLSCFAGQSAVGKSSLLNALDAHLNLETGGLSRKTERGRHTTRHAELLTVGEGFALDTPGFSLLELDGMEPEELCAFYPEMRAVESPCRFPHCLHASEPDCAVKAALARGEIPQGRYERYLLLLEELKEKRKRKYD